MLPGRLPRKGEPFAFYGRVRQGEKQVQFFLQCTLLS